MEEHPTPGMFNAFLKGTLSRPDVRRIVKHLSERCEPCSRLLAEKAKAVGIVPSRRREGTGSGSQYNSALVAGERWVRRQLRLRDDPPRPLLFPSAGDSVQSFYALLEASQKERYRDPAKMLQLATEAQMELVFLKAEDFPPGAKADLCARGNASLANAYRVNDDFVQARLWFDRALGHWEAGSQDALLLAYILDFVASLHCHLGEYERAFADLDVVFLLYSEGGDPHLAGRALITKGIAKNYANATGEGMDLTAEGLALIDPARDPQLHVATVHNLLVLHSESGAHAEGRRLLAEHKALYARHADPLNLLKLQWLEAKIAAGLGERAEAEEAYRDVRESLVRLHMGLDAALVSVDLSLVLLEQGRLTEIAALATETIAVFERLGLQREAIAVWLVVERAARQERATAALLQGSAARLRELLGNRPKGRPVP